VGSGLRQLPQVHPCTRCSVRLCYVCKTRWYRTYYSGENHCGKSWSHLPADILKEVIAFKHCKIETWSHVYSCFLKFHVQTTVCRTANVLLLEQKPRENCTTKEVKTVLYYRVLLCCSVQCLQFVSKTHLFFSCSQDGTIKQWDADSFELITTLQVCHLPFHFYVATVDRHICHRAVSSAVSQNVAMLCGWKDCDGQKVTAAYCWVLSQST